MIKRMLIAAILTVACAVSVRADTGTYDIMNDSFTIINVNISSSTVGGTKQLFTAVLNGATTSFPLLLENRKVMEIENTDSTSNAWCVINLSSTSANGDLSLDNPNDLSTTGGRKITPGGTWVLGLPSRDNTARVFMPWCVNDSGSGTIKLAISQGRTK